MNFITNILVTSIAVLIVSYLLPGVKVDTFTTALLVALVLAFMNAIVKPILTILTIPITILSLGLFLIVINGLIIIITDRMVDGFEVRGFWWALLFSFILSITTGILNMLIGNHSDEDDHDDHH
jgi:putative membrane protein